MALASGSARADLIEFEGRIVFDLPGFDVVEAASGSGVADVGALGAQLTRLQVVDVGDISGRVSIPVTDPTAAPVTSILITASMRSGHLTIDPAAPPLSRPAVVDNSALVGGQGFICMLVAPLPPCIGGFPFQLTKSRAAGVGVGGLLTIGGTGTFRISVYGAPFTINTASLLGQTTSGATFPIYQRGFVHGPNSFTGTTAIQGGVVQLVTPMRSAAVGGGSGAITGFARLSITFVPEPRRALFLGSGALCLVVLGRHRRLTSEQRGVEAREES